ncbi:MAG: hypothetical protein M0Z52_03845 [Actinomycetota bacterium]|nr:hypothetical protein [Actinomycetota bacterium]
MPNNKQVPSCPKAYAGFINEYWGPFRVGPMRLDTGSKVRIHLPGSSAQRKAASKRGRILLESDNA